MTFLRRLLVPLIAMLVAACSEEDATGPVDIIWDRDTCALCQMVISDARFAAQVRGGPKRKVEKFDDIGCAINWLNDKPWAAAPETEIWIAERHSTRERVVWLDARKAFYVREVLTPMNYGFGAEAERTPGALTFEEVTNRILTDSPNHICPTR